MRSLLAATAVVSVGLAGAVAHAGSVGEPYPSTTVSPVLAVSEGTSPARITQKSRSIRHFEYVVADGAVYAYDIDRRHRLVQHVSLPGMAGVRGVVASPATHMLYISFRGFGGVGGNGSMLAYDLLRDKVLWQRNYSTGIDSMAITPNGKTIYMPTGSSSAIPVWLVIDARDGRVTGSITAGAAPHNTIVSLDGSKVFLGNHDYDYLEVADTATNQVVEKIGPLVSGVRPFTINGAATLAYTTATQYLGFQVSSIVTGKVLYTVPFTGFPYDPAIFTPTAPSHGISLSPDERELYVLDSPNDFVHVFDVSDVPSVAPRPVAVIKLLHGMSGSESPCKYSCLRDGWLQHSRDGRYVYVGDAGDVIATGTRTIVAFLPALRETRKMLEVDWRHGLPIRTTTRSGLGYVRPR